MVSEVKVALAFVANAAPRALCNVLSSEPTNSFLPFIIICGV